MSTSSTSVPESQDQIAPAKPTEAQSRLAELIATAEALDAQLEAASRGSRKSRSRRRTASHPVQSQRKPNSDLERHGRKCKICKHPERELIEADFIQWRHPGDIADAYRIAYDGLYRHATATGLFELRRENVSIVVQKVLEEVEYVQEPSAAAILRAVRTLRLDSRGRWTEPPTTHVVVNTTERPVESPNSVTTSSPVSASNGAKRSDSVSSLQHPASSVQNSNRKIYEKLEVDINRT